MVSRRDEIRLNDEEIRDFLKQSLTVIVNSIGKHGVPHPIPMWYGVEDDGAIVMTTFTKSQKIQNLKRDPRVSLLVEDGTTYSELRGVVIYGTAELLPDTETVAQFLLAVTSHRGELPAGVAPDSIRAALRRQAKKRTGIRVRPEKIVSWDHRKLGGA